MLLRAAALLALGPLLAGCLLNTSETRISDDYTARIDSAGVVSLIGSRPNVSSLATSALESRFAHADIAGWDSARIVHQRLVPRLVRKGLNARAVSPTGALAAAQAADWREPGAAGIAEAVYALCADSGLDMMVVAQAQVDEDFVTGTNQNVRGFGLQKAFDTGPFLYATVHVEAFDCRKRFSVGRASGRQHEAADAALWDAAFDDAQGTLPIDGARGTALAARLEALLGTALAIAAQEAGL